MILLSAILGSLTTFLTMTVVLAARKFRGTQSHLEFPRLPVEPVNDRPPPDYAAKTTEGISNPRLEQLRQAGMRGHERCIRVTLPQ